MAIKLPDVDADSPSKGSKVGKLFKLVVFGFLGWFMYGLLTYSGDGLINNVGSNRYLDKELCGHIDPIAPNFDKSLDVIYGDAEFKFDAIKKLSGAIRVRTEIGDAPPSPKDDPDYYKEFKKYHKYLEKEFPNVYSKLKVEKVNEYALIYTWEGSDKSLKPLMLTAHQDVVLVNPDTVDQWDHDPFGGDYDSETDTVWGRGSADCKALGISELVAVEQLLKDGFEPERTVIIAFGFDEESSGSLGAGEISKHLEEKYGKDGIYAIVDEGGGVTKINDKLYIAAPVTGEKGYLDTEVIIHGVGGHSSAPPDHNNIGVASQLINLFEENPFSASFDTENPFFGVLACEAEHDDEVPFVLRKAILTSPHSSGARTLVAKYLSSKHGVRDLLRTTRSVDIIHGGVKSNALPEEVRLLVNHRIHLESSVNETLQADVDLIKQIAEKYNYGVTVEGEELIAETDLGFIEVKTLAESRPAPNSPIKDSAVWNLFTGTIQDVFENHVFADQDDVEFYVGSSLSTGNTDTRHYLNLTRNIYRFEAGIALPDLIKTMHSVNEHVSASSYISSIGFIYEYIVNVSEHKDE